MAQVTSYNKAPIYTLVVDTPEQVLEKLLTVDGTGSGLDADLLGGMSVTDLENSFIDVMYGIIYAQAVGNVTF